MQESSHKIQRRLVSGRSSSSKLPSLCEATDTPQRSHKVYPNHCCKHSRPAHFQDNVQYEESLQNVTDWLSQQYDHPLYDGDDGEEDISSEHLSALLHKMNEALEARDEFDCDHKMERRNFDQELIFKINEVLKTEECRIPHTPRDITLQQSEDNWISCDPIYPLCEDFHPLLDYFPQSGDLSRAGEAIVDDDDFYEDDDGFLIPSSMYKRTSFQGNYDANVHECHYDDNAADTLLHRGDSCMIIEGQFTGVSLEYWGGHWIDSVEHTLSQSEWLGSPKWQQPLSNQQDWFNNDIQKHNRTLYDSYACM